MKKLKLCNRCIDEKTKEIGLKMKVSENPSYLGSCYGCGGRAEVYDYQELK